MPRRRPFQRTDRLNREILRILAVAMGRESREESLRFATLSGVEVTRDLSLARVYVQVDRQRRDEVLKALERASGFLRGRVGRELRIRQTPDLRFILDDSLDRVERITSILNELDIPEDLEPAEEE